MGTHQLQHQQQHHAGQPQDGVAHPADRGSVDTDSEARARGLLWLSFPSIETESLYTAEAVLEFVILLPAHSACQDHRREYNSQWQLLLQVSLPSPPFSE